MTSESKSSAGQQSVAEVPERSLITLLVVVTFTTGVMDAVSVLGLGDVFTANMTGNVVFLGGSSSARIARKSHFGCVRLLLLCHWFYGARSQLHAMTRPRASTRFV